MGKAFKRGPCPLCSYGAFSDADLEAHKAHAHPGNGAGSGPSVVAEAPPPPPVAVAPVPVPEPEPQAATAEAPPSQPAGHPALKVPEADDTFWVDDKVVRLLHTVGRISAKGEVVNVLLVGPKGTGKTSLPKEFAAANRRPFFTVHCQLIAERDDWWGSKELSMERGTYFEKAAFLDAVETPGCVILLDEANRTHPENLNALFGFLDHRRKAWVPALKREVEVASGAVFFVTLNEGYEYVGTNPIDEALRDRMTYAVRMGYVPKKVEKAILTRRTGVDEEPAEKLAEFARTVRRNPKLGVPVSTRQLLGAASLVAEGMALQDAVLFSVVNSMGEDVDRKALLQALPPAMPHRADVECYI
ncbi:MAG: AAA family ATPase, partial [Pseudomonadota bacterium]